MILLSLLASVQVATLPVPARFEHTSYQRLTRDVQINASARFILVRPSPSYRIDAVEKTLAEMGAGGFGSSLA